jgi:hypothetical protein
MNTESLSRELTEAEIKKLSSPYLNEGRKQESWQVDRISVTDDMLYADVSMKSIYLSDTDDGSFHLTIFSTLEFLSELMIIYVHVWAGLEEKTQEGWMVECKARNIKAIRNPDAIKVEMHVESIRRRGKSIRIVTDCRVVDDRGGLFKVWLKGFLA